MTLLKKAKELEPVLVSHRRYIHENAELGMDTPKTTAYIKAELEKMGYEPEVLGGSGVVALAGKKPGRTILLRADFDALPIAEESGLEFACETGIMHACGHDCHTAMLLGAARLLKDHEDELAGQVKLMFQPAEEVLTGCQMMIDHGVLEHPKVDAAVMLHVTGSMDLPVGTIVVPDSAMAAADWFVIRIQGKGCHGAMPHTGVDPLNVLSHIHIALQEINAREIAPQDTVALTIGRMQGGRTSNVIPDTAEMAGTIRTLDNSLRERMKRRLTEIAKGMGAVFGAEVEVEFEGGCPSMVVDQALKQEITGYLRDALGGQAVVDLAELAPESQGMGSEDFSCISVLLPTVTLSIASGGPKDGCHYPIHHPKTAFAEAMLPSGAAAYAEIVMRWLINNN